MAKRSRNTETGYENSKTFDDVSEEEMLDWLLSRKKQWKDPTSGRKLRVPRLMIIMNAMINKAEKGNAAMIREILDRKFGKVSADDKNKKPVTVNINTFTWAGEAPPQISTTADPLPEIEEAQIIKEKTPKEIWAEFDAKNNAKSEEE